MRWMSKWILRSATLGCVTGSLLGGTAESRAQFRTVSSMPATGAIAIPADPVPVAPDRLPTVLPPYVPSKPAVPAVQPKQQPPKVVAPAPAPPLVPVPADPALPAVGEKTDAPKPAECPNPWAKIPPVRIFPRPGNFAVPPSGPGFYSLTDVVNGECREKPPKFPYPPIGPYAASFFDADFRYLEDPKNTQHDLFDPLHRIHLGDCWLFNTGGEFRDREMVENNSRLSGRDNTYNLQRVRTYADLWYGDAFRIFGEFIYAGTSRQNLTPLGIDRNFGDIQNLFVDVKLADIDDHGAYLRVGRQEMLLGSQRLISPLDWANTRRTFQGVSAFREGEKFDLTAFWVQPVIPNASRLDSVDDKQNFAGIWATYRPQKGTFFDLYYLWLNNPNNVTQLGDPRSPTTVNTLGTRYAGNNCDFLFDGEAMLQLGDVQTRNLVAGAATAGLGYNFSKLPLNPTIWAYYDWASGTNNPGTGTNHTFNQLFPFGHYYFGFIDDVGRQNLQDLNAHLYLYPAKWITLNAQFHHFTLDSATDALYNAGGAAIRRDATGRAGTNVGDELDLVANFHLGAHSDILIGYSVLFPGSFIQQTVTPATAGSGRNQELFYVQYSFRW